MLAGLSKIFSGPTWDVGLVLALLAVGFFYGLYCGKKRLTATIIYTYVALALLEVARHPMSKILDLISGHRMSGTEWQTKTIIFILLFFLLTLLLGSKKGRGFSSGGSWWQIFLLSFTQVGFLAHLVLNFLPPEKIASLTLLTRKFFAAPDYHLWWMIAPITLVILMRRIDK